MVESNRNASEDDHMNYSRIRQPVGQRVLVRVLNIYMVTLIVDNNAGKGMP